jgi:hypothetical protein
LGLKKILFLEESINQLILSILSVFAVPDEGPSLVRKFAHDLFSYCELHDVQYYMVSLYLTAETPVGRQESVSITSYEPNIINVRGLMSACPEYQQPHNSTEMVMQI